jgi:hypothetical protein
VRVNLDAPFAELPTWIFILNQVYELERKLNTSGDPVNGLRNVRRIRDALENVGVFYEDPMGQSFDETRTDLEASIAGTSTEHLVVVQVLKPIVRAGPRERSRVVQCGIVVVEQKTTEGDNNE